MKIKFFVVMVVVVLALFCVTLASGTVTTFKTGPFTGSISYESPSVNKYIPNASIMKKYIPNARIIYYDGQSGRPRQMREKG
jgi:hypothetical protein